MRRAVDGLLSVVTLETTLPLLKDVTVTFLTAGFFAVVATLRVAVGEVLRVRVLRVFVGVAAGDLTGIKRSSFVYSYIIAIKNPLWGFSGHFVNWPLAIVKG